jgi:AraC-like DNA-binding protein
MIIFDDDRPSDSPYVERIWRCHGEPGGTFLSIAESRCELVVTRRGNTGTLTVRGPETVATDLGAVAADSEWVGIRLKPGTCLRHLPAHALVDAAVTLPSPTGKSFMLDGSAWQFPDYENAETFIDRLRHDDLLFHEPLVGNALHGEVKRLSKRSVQRRFLQATGLTERTARQIERARYATLLLRDGVSIAGTAVQAGYFDQPHLTRSLKRFIGQTPAQILGQRGPQQLSFLYETAPFG